MGSLVGPAVGAAVGLLEGSAVGAAVGLLEGSAVGSAVGLLEGSAVGAAVDSLVGSAVPAPHVEDRAGVLVVVGKVVGKGRAARRGGMRGTDNLDLRRAPN